MASHLENILLLYVLSLIVYKNSALLKFDGTDHLAIGGLVDRSYLISNARFRPHNYARPATTNPPAPEGTVGA